MLKRHDEPYKCPELKRNPGIPDSRFRAFELPSRADGRLYYPDGRVEPIPAPHSSQQPAT